MTISSVKVAPEAEVMDRSGAVYYTGPPPMVVTGVPFYPGMMQPVPVPIPTAQQVPWKMVMDRSSLFDGVTMKQTTKGCMRFGPCQPNMEWTAHEYTHSYGEGDAIEDKLFLWKMLPILAVARACAALGGGPLGSMCGQVEFPTTSSDHPCRTVFFTSRKSGPTVWRSASDVTTRAMRLWSPAAAICHTCVRTTIPVRF